MLQTALNGHPEVVCFGELVHDLYRHDRGTRTNAEYLEDRVFCDRPVPAAAAGWKLCTNGVSDDILEYLQRHGFKVIHVRRRNLLAQYVSLRIAETLDRYQRFGFQSPESTATVRVDPGEFRAWAKSTGLVARRLRLRLRTLDWHEAWYEDLTADFDAQTARLLRFLGVAEHNSARRWSE